jgi:hypothetical protein
MDVLNSVSTIYLDDGSSRRAEENEEYSIIFLDSEFDGLRYEILMTKEGFGYTGEQLVKEMIFDVKRVKSKPENVLFQSSELPFVLTYEEFLSIDNCVLWSDADGLLVKVSWNSGNLATLVIDGMMIEENLSIDDILTDQNLKIFPNPIVAGSDLTLAGLSDGVYKISLIDPTGRILAETKERFIEGTTATLNLHNLSGYSPMPGIYGLRIQARGMMWQRRLIVL